MSGRLPDPGGGRTALVADDDAESRAALAGWLEGRGYRVVLADDGLGAVTAALRERPGLILVEMFLPGLDGFAATRLLRAHEETREVPILALSCYDEAAFRLDAAAAGCDDYLIKPVDLLLLEKVLSRITGGA